MTDYFVSTTGDDANPGTEALPWRNPNKGNTTLSPGDTLYIKAGVYQGGMWARVAGTPSDVINRTNFGDDEVIIEGGYEVSGWSLHSGAIYVAPWASDWLDPNWEGISGEVGFVIVDDYINWLAPATSTGAMVAGSWYFDIANQNLYIWIANGSDPAGHTVWAPKDYNDSAYGMLLDQYSHNIVDGITFRMFGSGVIYGVNDPRYCEASYNKIYSVHRGIVAQKQAANCIADNNEIYHTISAGIQWNASYSTITYNNVYETGIVDWQRWGNTGILLMGDDNYCAHNEISNTGFRSTHGTGLLFEMFGDYGEGTGATCNRNIAEHNYIHDIPDYVGVSFYGSNDCIVRNNIIENTLVGVRCGLGGTAGNPSEDERLAYRNKAYNNTIVGSVEAGVKLWDGTRDFEQYNNILDDTTLAISTSVEASTEFASDYNGYQFTGGAPFNIGAGGISFAAYKTATSQDTASLEADPMFVNKTASDYRLKLSSTFLYAGSNSTDIGYGGREVALSNLLPFQFNTLALTLTNPQNTPTGDGATLTIESNSDLGTLYSYSKTTPFTGTDEENAAEIMANGVGQVPSTTPNGTDPETYTNTRVVTDQDTLTDHYAGWVQDTEAP